MVFFLKERRKEVEFLKLTALRSGSGGRSDLPECRHDLHHSTSTGRPFGFFFF